MKNKDELYALINTHVVEITEQVAGLELSESHPVELKDLCTVHLAVRGSYQLDLFLYADKKTMEHIASNMKKSPVVEEEIKLYTVEFFNILGGRIVSKINRQYKQSARFTPPAFFAERVEHNIDDKDVLTLFYRHSSGNVKVEGQFAKCENF